jgi:hypothetical protein
MDACTSTHRGGYHTGGCGEAGGQPCYERKVVRAEIERRFRTTAQAGAEARGEETPFELEFSGDDGEVEDVDGGAGVGVGGEKISPPQSPMPPPPESLLLLGDLFGRLIRIPARVHQAKRPQADAGGVSSLSLQSDLALVCSFW